MIKKIIILLFITHSFLFISHCYPQGVSINTKGAAADLSAILDVSSSSKGLLVPRLTTVQRNSITSPALSLLIFNTTTDCFEAFVNGQWYSVSCAPPCTLPLSPASGAQIPSSNSIVWKWNSVSGAAGYKFSTLNNYNSAVDNSGNISYTQTGLKCNTNYSLFVWAYNGCGNSSSTSLSQITSACSDSGTVNTIQTDIDVDNNGRLFVAKGTGNIFSVRFYDPAVNYVNEITANPAPVDNKGASFFPSYVFTSRIHKNVILAWEMEENDNPALNGIYAAIYDKNTQTIVKNTFLILNMDYAEFFDIVLDDNGNFVVAANNDRTTKILWYDASGNMIKIDSLEDFSSAGYGCHLAMNKTTGAGILGIQEGWGGDVLYYQRWDAARNWIDPSPVHVPAESINWYDGFTVGMNDKGEFAFEWRFPDSEWNASNDIRFCTYDASGNMVTSPTMFSTISGWYDPYRYRHAHIQIKNNNFILGETVGNAYPVPAAVTYYQYTLNGALVNTYTTKYFIPLGMTHRLDGLGRSFFFDGNTIFFKTVF